MDKLLWRSAIRKYGKKPRSPFDLEKIGEIYKEMVEESRQIQKIEVIGYSYGVGTTLNGTSTNYKDMR